MVLVRGLTWTVLPVGVVELSRAGEFRPDRARFGVGPVDILARMAE